MSIVTDGRIARQDLVRQLGASVGQDKAAEALSAALLRLQLDALTSLDREQTMAALDELARTHGLMGTVARFAKARIILLFGDGE